MNACTADQRIFADNVQQTCEFAGIRMSIVVFKASVTKSKTKTQKFPNLL